MNKWQRILVVLSVLSLIFTAACRDKEVIEEETEKPVPQEETGPVVGTRVGDIAPDFRMQSAGGENTSLADVRGTPVILNFWASWCEPCVGELPLFEQIYEEQGKGIFLLCINLGDIPAMVGEFMQAKDLVIPVMLDMQSSVGNKYNVTALPTTYFIDKDGIIRGKVVGAFQTKESIERYLVDIVK